MTEPQNFKKRDLWNLDLGAAPAAKPEPPPESAPAKLSTGQAVTDAGLGDMLANMGYEYTTSKSTDGKITFYKIVLKRDTWTVPISVHLSSGHTMLWMDVFLSSVDDLNKCAPAALAGLLAGNWNGSGFFVCDEARKNLYFSQVVPNNALTPVVLRKCLEDLAGQVKNTNALWKEETLKA